MKTCTKCGKTKPITGFSKNSANRDGHHTRCKECTRAYSAAWYAGNPDAPLINQNRRARGIKSVGMLSKGLADKLFALQRGKCACGCKQPLGDDYHLDHIIPLALGGANTDDNIQLLRPLCNHQKNAKHPIDFMQSRGYLL